MRIQERAELCYSVALAQTVDYIITGLATPEIVLRLYSKKKCRAEWVVKTLDFLTGGDDDKRGTCLRTLLWSCDLHALLKLVEDSDMDSELKTWILTQPYDNDTYETIDPNPKLFNVEGAKQEFPKFLATWKTKEDVQSFISRYRLRYTKENPLGVKTYTGGITKRTLTDIVNDLKKVLNEEEKKEESDPTNTQV